MQQTRRDVFQGIADPTRREIIRLLTAESMTINAVADQFKMSRPAISKHMRILQQCGLLTVYRQGRERHCRTNLQKLKEVHQWLDYYRTFWNQKLDSLGHILEKGK